MRTVVSTSSDSVPENGAHVTVQVASDRPEECERSNLRISDHGAKIAASRLGISVADYRAHEAAGDRWCPRCASWMPAGQPFVLTNRLADRGGYCAPCYQAYRSGLALDERIFSLTPEGVEAASSIVQPPIVSAQHLVSRPASALSGHQNCPPSLRDLCEGNLPEGWVKSGGAS